MKREYWLSAAVIAVALAIGSVLFAWRNDRVIIHAALSGRTVENLSSTSKQELIQFMRSEESILAIQMTKADLVKNQRRGVFFLADNVELQAAWDDFLTHRPPPPPLFANAEEAKYNDRIANLFNGVAFDCRMYRDTLNFALIPKINDVTPWICSTPVPPGYDGDFVGFLTFYMKTEPKGKERDRLSLKAIDLSTNIYKRDIAK